MSLIAYLLDVLLGPIGLLLGLGELQVLLGEINSIITLLTSGQVVQLTELVLAGEYATAGHLLANVVGTLLWLAVLGTLLGGFGEVGELGELAELGELFD